MKNLSDRIAALTPAQRALLEKQMQQKGMGKQAAPAQDASLQISTRGHNRPSPLSFDQERLWLYQQMEPEKSTYNVYFGFRLYGRVDVLALTQSLNHIVERQQAWRTTFRLQDGKPVQIIRPDARIELPVHDLTAIAEGEREGTADVIKTELMQQPFDLEKGPVLRAALIRMREEEFIFVLAVHHAVTDRVSFSVFFDELMTCYRSFVTASSPELPDLPIQYADYAEWQRQWLQGDEREKLVSYWKNHLSGSSLTLDLPTDFPRQAEKSDRGAREYFQMPLDLLEAVKALARQLGMTPNMIFIAAYHAMLHRYSNQQDIIVGTPLTNRDHQETERIIGYFLTMIPLRVQFSTGMTFRELLQQVRQVSLNGYAHRQLPFGLMLDELKPERDPSRNPIIQAVFVYVDVPEDPFVLEGLRALTEQLDGGTSIYDLNLGVIESAGGISLVEYNSDLFLPQTIQRMIGHYLQILQAVVADPDLAVSQLPLLTDQEREELIVQRGSHQVFQQDTRTVAQLFEAQVAHAPDRVAVVCEEGALSYRELNERANRLARRLRRLGVEQDSLVGLCVERSSRMLVGLLAILKAGGAYVPLDPAYPQERLRYLVQDSGIRLVVTERDCRVTLALSEATCILLDVEAALLEESAENLPSDACADSLAYVIYTSGSTGQPKGVMITHANVVRLFQAAEEHFSFTGEDVWTLFHSFSFDFSVWEIWGALLHGGRLVIVPYAVSRSPEDFYQLLCKEGVTVLNQTPSAFRQLISAEEMLGVSKNLALRYVIFGGEALHVQTLAPWIERHGDAAPQLVNMYGITETTVHVTYRAIRQSDLEAKAGSVIGRPLLDLHVLLLDEHLQPVPVGVCGEIFVGGSGLARGYLNRAELTAERFIPHPFQPGERLYRSGDLARYLHNGELEYAGRLDDQVKIRGFRIELGEIEAALRQAPGVQEATACVREDLKGHPQAVGYVVRRANATVSDSQLRLFLRDRLPEHMIPASFVILDQPLPLTANGKIDRAALPAPDRSNPHAEKRFVEPETETETQLAEIWRDVLQLESISILDNFFERGGDSILSISITARARQKGLLLQPRDLFKYQTIADLARVVGTLSQETAEQGAVTGTVLNTPIQQWFFEQELEDPHHWNLPLLLQVPPQAEVEWLQAAADHLIEHHDALRMRYRRTHSGWEQTNEPVQKADFRHVDLRFAPDDEGKDILQRMVTERQAALDLSQSPLVQFIYFDCGTERHGRLLLLMHHLIVDTVSWRILAEDLETLYRQLASSQPLKLPPKTLSFKRWSEKLHEMAQSERIRKELPHWMSVTQQAPKALPLDLQGDNTEESADALMVSLDAEETRALLQDVPKAYRTEINDVLLTALAQTFASWTGQRSLLVDLEGHGREPIAEDADLSRTVGWFTSMYPVRINLSDLSDLGEDLKGIKEQLRAIPNKGIGYGMLRYLSVDETIKTALREMPQSEVSFNYLGRLEQAGGDQGLFHLSEDPVGPIRSAKGKRSHLLQIAASVVGGHMQILWGYSANCHQKATIEQLAQRYRECLRQLIAHCQTPGTRSFTPSDFPAAKLNQKDLSKLMSQLGKGDRSR